MSGVLFSATWVLDGTSLTFHQSTSDAGPSAFLDAVWGGQAWERIG